MADWISFWNSDHPIYVNARHRDVHYRKVAADMRRYVPSSDATVMDYGCGEALHADVIAEAAGRLILCDAAPNVREKLAARFTRLHKVSVLSPKDVTAMRDHSLDLIIMHSVAQYLKPGETDGMFALFRRLLKPGGVFVLGDVIPPKVSPLTDAAALLRFAAAHGFLVAAVLGLVRTVFSDYPKLRAALGLTLYDEAAIINKLGAAGFTVQRAPENIGHNQARMTFVATPA